jgi:2',3'-cyclic-nucleotide 2'-phosphodiesterase (5'-nucleotidase family)
MKENRIFVLVLSIAILLSLIVPGVTSVKALEDREIVILGTADIHGNVRNYDYFTDSVPPAHPSVG